MKFIHLLAVSVLVLLPAVSFLSAQPKLLTKEADPNWTPREHPLDFRELLLDVHFDTTNGKVFGKVTHIFSPIRKEVKEFSLDAKEGLIIRKTTLDGKPIAFSRPDSSSYLFTTTNTLTWGKTYSLTLEYDVKPRRGLYFVGWDDSSHTSRRQIWTQGQGIDNRCWIPMYDEMNDKIISDLTITFAKGYEVLSNGKKLKVTDNKDGSKTWHYRIPAPHAPYLIMLAIGKYHIKETKSPSGIPIKLYYYPDQEIKTVPTYRYTEKIFSFLEKETGVPYPWGTYAQIPVQDFMYGAMENTTATVFGDFYCVDERAYLDRNYVATNAHELTHMWFGDLITARSSSHSWLQESFATYYQWLFDGEVFGKDQFDWDRKQAISQALLASQSDKKAVASSEGGTTRWYPKGAFVLDMLRNLVGPEAYQHTIKRYLNQHAYKNVDTHELMLAFQDELGYSLQWFFDQWIYKGGEPSLKISYRDLKVSGKDRFTEVTVQQTQEVTPLVGFFKLPLVVEIWYKDGSKDSVYRMIENETNTIVVPNKKDQEIDFVLADPNSRIMKSVSFDRGYEELAAQALKAPNMLDRYDALVALRSTEPAKKRELFIQVFKKETSYITKSEAITQLGSDKDPAAQAIVMEALTDRNVNVRKAAVATISVINSQQEPILVRLLKDSSYILVETVLEKLSNNFPDKSAGYLSITKNETGNYSHNIRIRWLEISLQKQINTGYLNELIAYSGNGYEFRTRDLAMQSLRKLNYCDKQVIKNLANASAHFNNRLVKTSDETLQYFSKQTAFRKMMQESLENGVLSTGEKQALRRNLRN